MSSDLGKGDAVRKSKLRNPNVYAEPLRGLLDQSHRPEINLSSQNKVVPRNSICKQNSNTIYFQGKNLYNKKTKTKPGTENVVVM